MILHFEEGFQYDQQYWFYNTLFEYMIFLSVQESLMVTIKEHNAIKLINIQ